MLTSVLLYLYFIETTILLEFYSLLILVSCFCEASRVVKFYTWCVILFANVSTIQLSSPIRAEIEVKLGGTQCNIIMSRLKPWLRFHYSKKKRIVLQEEKPALEKLQSTESKAIMWTCTVSAPEMTVVLYSISGLPVYHVSNLFVVMTLCRARVKWLNPLF